MHHQTRNKSALTLVHGQDNDFLIVVRVITGDGVGCNRLGKWALTPFGIDYSAMLTAYDHPARRRVFMITTISRRCHLSV